MNELQSFADGGGWAAKKQPYPTSTPYSPSKGGSGPTPMPHGGYQGPSNGAWTNGGALKATGPRSAHGMNQAGKSPMATGAWTLPNRPIGMKAEMRDAGFIVPAANPTTPLGRPQPTILQRIQSGLIGAGLNAIVPGAGLAYGAWTNRGALSDMFGGGSRPPVINNRPPGG